MAPKKVKDESKPKKREKEPRELRHYPLSPIAVPLANEEGEADEWGARACD